jgi:hypothetical protein
METTLIRETFPEGSVLHAQQAATLAYRAQKEKEAAEAAAKAATSPELPLPSGTPFLDGLSPNGSHIREIATRRRAELAELVEAKRVADEAAQAAAERASTTPKARPKVDRDRIPKPGDTVTYRSADAMVIEVSEPGPRAVLTLAHRSPAGLQIAKSIRHGLGDIARWSWPGEEAASLPPTALELLAEASERGERVPTVGLEVAYASNVAPENFVEIIPRLARVTAVHGIDSVSLQVLDDSGRVIQVVPRALHVSTANGAQTKLSYPEMWSYDDESAIHPLPRTLREVLLPPHRCGTCLRPCRTLHKIAVGLDDFMVGGGLYRIGMGSYSEVCGDCAAKVRDILMVPFEPLPVSA